MKELFSLLKLPTNASKEDVKVAFLEWKKEQQKILISSKREEQKLITENISKVTVLYKNFMSDFNETSNIIPNDMDIGSETTKVIPENVKSITPLSKTQNNLDNFEKQGQNIAHVALVVLVAILVCVLLFGSLTDKNKKNVAHISTNSIFSNDKNKTPTNKGTEKLKTQELQKQQEEPKKVTENKRIEKPEENQKKDVDKNVGKTQPQRDAIQVLLNFHDGITRKDLRRSYNCLSKDFQNHMSYEGWTPGFDTTVSSEVSDIKITSESSNKIVLTYVLKAVDNIKGKQEVAYFNGTVDIINEGGNWKIDGIKNKVR